MTQSVFVSPPGWPSFPPGTVPAATWLPPAELPPPPPGWVFYRGLNGEPVAPPVNAWQPHPAMNPTPPAPMGAPAPMAPQPMGVAAPPRKRRRVGLWLGLGLGGALLVGLIVLGVVAYSASMAPPTISAANAARITNQTTFGSRTVTWKAADPTVGTPPDLPGCKEWSQLINNHAVDLYSADDEAPGLLAFFFDSPANAQNVVAQWKICDFSGGSSKSSLDKSGTTDGVFWLANSEWGYLSYGSVVVIGPLTTDDLTASIAATKKLVNALR